MRFWKVQIAQIVYRHHTAARMNDRQDVRRHKEQIGAVKHHFGERRR